MKNGKPRYIGNIEHKTQNKQNKTTKQEKKQKKNNNEAYHNTDY
jgi:hypothetical protein